MSIGSILKEYVLRWEVIVAAAIVGFVGLYAVRFFLYEPFRIPSESMHPTLPQGSIVIVRKLGFGNYGSGGFQPIRTQGTAPVRRGDIIVFGLPNDMRTSYIMRVVGLAGDHVAYKNHRLSINGRELPIAFGESDVRYRYATETIDDVEATIAFMPERYSREVDVHVPKDHLYVLGDSRDNARDSRYIGFVPRANVVGVYVMTLSD